MSNALQTANDNQSLLSKENIDHAMKIADLLSKSDMTPKAYKGKAADVLIAMELGRTWNLSPLQAIQNIAVINGKPCAYGDLVLAICQGHPDFKNIDEKPIMDGNNVVGYRCIISRKDRSDVEKTFTKEQAQKAGLWGKSGPWTQYPERMLQMRARAFALRDSFADALNGVAIREEVQDMAKEKDITPEYKPQKSDEVLDIINKSKTKEIEHQPEPAEETGEVATPEQIKQIHALINEKNFNQNGRLVKALEHYGVETLGQLTALQADDFILKMQKDKGGAKADA